MTKLSIEAKVGALVIVGIILLAYMSMKVGLFEYGADRGYEVHALFDSAEGLVKGVPVQIAGVEVGRVKDIALEGGKAKVTMRLNPDVKVGKDVEAAIRTKGVLGDKYVELVLGDPKAAPLEPGEEIPYTTSPANLDTLLKQLSAIGEDIKRITGPISNVVGGDGGEDSLRMIVENLRDLTETLNQTVQANEANINRTLSNLDLFSSDLREISSTNKEELREMVANFSQASGQLRETIVAVTRIVEKIDQGEGTIGRLVNEEETVENLNQSLAALKEISEKVNRGEGTIGKLVKDEETVENLNDTLEGVNEYIRKEARFKTFVDYRGEYLFDSSDVKSYLSLRIQPQEDKYYLLQVVDDPAGETDESEIVTTVNGVTTVEKRTETDKDTLKFSAQIAKRYYDLGLRGGIFESTGGVAADYYFFKDRVTLSLEAFDFDPDENPHLKLKADYTPFQYLYLTAGLDHFISDRGDGSFFLGAGLHFSDEDIKTLLSGAPIP